MFPTPRFITFEGIDGSGKSTQVRLLMDWLAAEGVEAIYVREPGGTPLGEGIRAWLLDPSRHIGARAEALLFSAARAQLVDDVIVPALRAGQVVVADRYYDSSTVYQGTGRGLGDLSTLHAFATSGLDPDLTFWIDLPPAMAASRRLGREPDRMEEGAMASYQALHEAYLHLADLHPARIHRLDGTSAVDRIHQSVLNVLRGMAC